MWTKQYKKSKLRLVVVPVAAACMVTYFGFHAVNGTLGLNSSEKYAERIAELELELARLSEEREELAKRTTLLSDGSLDRDLIDEQARKALGVTQAGELVLLHSSN